MKKLINIFLILCISAVLTLSQSDLNKTPVTSKFYIVLNPDVQKQDLLNNLSEGSNLISFNRESIYDNNLQSISASKAMNNTPKVVYNSAIIEGNESVLTSLTSDEVVYYNKFIRSDDENEFCNSNVFYCKLTHVNERHELLKLAKRENFNIIGSDPMMPLWIVGYITNQSKITDIIEVVELLKSQSFVTNASVSKIVGSFSHCYNDPLFNNQWGLNNTAQDGGVLGTDIKLCEYESLGVQFNSTVMVAVFDRGVDDVHPDINNLTIGFDTRTNSIGADIYGDHGTACAGIIGATSDNNIGISGINDQCDLVPISNELEGTVAGIELQLALGFSWAWQNGVDIISCSWGSNALQDPILDNAINDALTLGRNGLGCIVVFSSGNDDGDVEYPANLNPDILAVGAVDRCGVRSGRIDRIPMSCDPWCPFRCSPASQFGDELDVVAPGSTVFTTDISGTGNTMNDYRNDFGGTSAAAAHVAGIASIILSIEPCITVQKVNSIIERSAQKVGGYPYQNEPGRPNGVWHEEVGYGLIDIEEAINLVMDQYKLQNHTESSEILVNSIGEIRAGREVTGEPTFGDYEITSSGIVEFKATDQIVLEAGFIVNEGAEFLAHIEDFTGNCTNWNNSLRKNNKIPNDSTYNVIRNGKNSKSLLNSVSKNKVNIFPNPFSNELLLSSPGIQEATVIQVEYYNSLGLFMKKEKIKLVDESDIISLSPPETKGIIFIRTCVSKENCTTSKFVRL